ncbi:amidohydrolase family protein [Natronosporangium hydrolyticum]|uniref:Amidohydrolase family protein n=1 Tax=Natronosporangium hydrolyticum TaxID=2811111 RepID=A0A895YEL1_9ACTN|nr:amidohydrolase family protein [Natronosporangium hydrolyticum]QSB12660.1 amidohydrolase family protein [Natronosporangium hydrolyticum]
MTGGPGTRPLLITGGHIVSLHPEVGDLPSGDLRIEHGVITAVGEQLPTGDAEVIDARDMLVLPGMVDTHTHLWESLFRGRVSESWGGEYFATIPPLGSWLSPEDTYLGTYLGAVELLANGVTAVLDYSHALLSPAHADAAVAALRAAGIRARFGYDLAGRDPAGNGELGPSQARFPDLERIAAELTGDELVQLAVCMSGVAPEHMATTVAEVGFARSLGAPLTYHNNTGGEVELLARAGVLGPDLLPAHGNLTTDTDLDLLASCGGFLSTQPEAETYSGRRPYSMVGRAHHRGVRVALGVDLPPLVNPAILPQMRLLYLLQRYLDGAQERAEGQVPVARRPGSPRLSAREVLRAGTVHGAAALGWAESVGPLAPGFAADLVLLDIGRFGPAEGDPAAQVVLGSHLGEIDTVIVGGELRKRAGRLLGVDLPAMAAKRLAARDRVLAAAGNPPPARQWWGWVDPTGQQAGP